MFPINLTIEIEDRTDLVRVFNDLKSKSQSSIDNLGSFFSHKSVQQTHFSEEEIESIRIYAEKALMNVSKILDFSEKIQELINKNKNVNDNYTIDSIEEYNSERYGAKK